MTLKTHSSSSSSTTRCTNNTQPAYNLGVLCYSIGSLRHSPAEMKADILKAVLAAGTLQQGKQLSAQSCPSAIVVHTFTFTITLVTTDTFPINFFNKDTQYLCLHNGAMLEKSFCIAVWQHTSHTHTDATTATTHPTPNTHRHSLLADM